MNSNDLIVLLSGGGSVSAALYLLVRYGPGVAEAIGRAIAEGQTRARLEEQRRLERQRADERRIEELEARIEDLIAELSRAAERTAAAEARALAATNERSDLQRRIATERPDAGRLLVDPSPPTPAVPPHRKDP